MSGHGFIGDPAREKADRLDLAISMLLRELDREALSPDARRLLEGLLAGDRDSELEIRRLLAEGPTVTAPDPGTLSEAALAENERLRKAVMDLCWIATPVANTDDGAVTTYAVPASRMHALVGVAQGAGIPAHFRNPAWQDVPTAPPARAAVPARDDLAAKVEELAEIIARVEARTVRDGQTGAITGYVVPADEWRSIRAALRALLADPEPAREQP